MTMRTTRGLRRTTAAAVVLLAVLTAAGCGKDDGSGVRNDAPTQAPGSGTSTKDKGNGY
jgi:hypothetical protein